MTQISLNGTGVASAGALSLQSNGTTEAIGISTGQVATLAQNPILTSGTANGVAYLNGSKVVTSGSALTFDGNALTLSGASAQVVIPDGKYYLFGAGYAGITGSGANSSSGYLAFATGSGGAERARIDFSGFFDIKCSSASDAGNLAFRVYGTAASADALAAYTVLYGTGYANAANSATKVGKANTTNRSINAAGTINASGADYAEYMTKASDFTIAKGDVVGINADGKLTNVFANAVSFAVKSTDPSYVGGDVWGNEEALGMTKPVQPIRIPDQTEQRLVSEATETEEAVYETVVVTVGDSDEEWTSKEAQYETEKATFEAALEAARQTVDRIAFAGQVPVNVTGANAGQYIVPINDNGAIKGQAISNPTFEQYQQAVGKVIAIEQDGRARIIVKIA